MSSTTTISFYDDDLVLRECSTEAGIEVMIEPQPLAC